MKPASEPTGSIIMNNLLASFSGVKPCWDIVGTNFFCGLAIEPEMTERNHFTQKLHHTNRHCFEEELPVRIYSGFLAEVGPDALKAL